MTSEEKRKLNDHGRALWLAGVTKEQLLAVGRAGPEYINEIFCMCVGWNDCQRRFEKELVR